MVEELEDLEMSRWILLVNITVWIMFVLPFRAENKMR